MGSENYTEEQESKLKPVTIPPGSRFVNVTSKVKSYGDESADTLQCDDVNIATIEVPMRIRLERRFSSKYQNLWVS